MRGLCELLSSGRSASAKELVDGGPIKVAHPVLHKYIHIVLSQLCLLHGESDKRSMSSQWA